MVVFGVVGGGVVAVALIGPHDSLASLHRFAFDMSRGPGRTCLLELVVKFYTGHS